MPLARTASNTRYCAAAGHAQRLWLWNSSNHSLVAAREQLEGLRYQGQQLRAALLAFGTEMDRRRDDDRRTDRYDRRRRDERSIDRLRARGYDRPGRGADGGGHSRRPRDDDRGYARDRRGDERRRRSRDDDDRRRRRRERSVSRSRSRSRHRLRTADDRARPHDAFPGGYQEPRRVFVGGVPKVTTEERFRRHFERFGTIDRVELNAERSFGFVTFAHAAMVDAVLATRMHQFEHAEHQTSFVEVRRPKPRGNQF